MPAIRLANGAIREFLEPITVQDLATSISAGLGRSALAGVVDGHSVDLSFLIKNDAHVQVVTDKDPQALDIVRHSTAHLMAHAVKELFPDAKLATGPTTDSGFFYDFSYKRSLTPDDLLAIEKRMIEISRRDLVVNRRVLSKQQALEHFRNAGEDYKVIILSAIAEDDDVSMYVQGDFSDLCRGPHVPSTGRLKVFKLTKVSGAYWRGDSKNEMLQRIYGTAWTNAHDQEKHLQMLAEAEKRDHRKLGRHLDLFHFQDEAPGLVFWHPRGWAVWQAVEQYMRKIYMETGYQEVKAPQVIDVALWQKTGHWDNYRENMFTTESESRKYALKPMNCPGHVQIYNAGLRSYRDLPLRYGEFGQCHRNESSGALHGLMRVRGFTQDDGHVFCTEEQIASEVSAFHRQANKVYSDFGFRSVDIKLALRPKDRIGTDEIWDRAEAMLRTALSSCGVTWTELPGEGAFYGPKIEYHLKDSLGRPWQVGTMQVDFSMPGRLGAEYVSEDNVRRVPVMLHRAIVGSMERFIGILIEHYAGSLPLWIAPLQVSVLPISEKHAAYAHEVRGMLAAAGFRTEVDARNEKVNFRIREQAMQKIPYILVVGDVEATAGTVSVRSRDDPELVQVTVEHIIEVLNKKMTHKN